MKMEIVPAIDLIDGKCVRLTEGDYSTTKVYRTDPLEVAREFEGVGVKRLHLVDLDGAKEGSVKHYKVLEKLAEKTNLTIDFGGGISDEQKIRSAFNAGAKMLSIGSAAVKQKDNFFNWIKIFGSEALILGADVKDRKIAVGAWQDITEIEIDDFLSEYTEAGVYRVLCTDISTDGTLKGPAIDLYKELLIQHPKLFFMASGGVSGIDDIYRLRDLGVPEAVVGKAIYEQRISLKEIENYNAK